MISSKKVGLEIINLCLHFHAKIALLKGSTLDPMYISVIRNSLKIEDESQWWYNFIFTKKLLFLTSNTGKLMVCWKEIHPLIQSQHIQSRTFYFFQMGIYRSNAFLLSDHIFQKQTQNIFIHQTDVFIRLQLCTFMIWILSPLIHQS